MKILFVEPHESSLFSFRKELVYALIDAGHEVILCTQATTKTINEFSKRVSDIIDVKIDLKDKGLLSNIRLKNECKRIINLIKPDLIISYKIKPNIYCGLYSKNIPLIANITGLGNIFKTSGLLSKVGIYLYKKSFSNVDYVFFQNVDGYEFFRKHKIPIRDYKIIPGSGVNIGTFKITPIRESNVTNFLFASRAIKEKGFDLLIEAIPLVLQKNSNVHFNFLSAEEDVFANDAAKRLFEEQKEYITILNRSDDMNQVYSENDVLIAPSYYREGISNVLLESLACGRPIITTNDNPGCKEVLQEDKNGFGVISNDLESLVKSILKAASCSKSMLQKMGQNGRDYVEKRFNRDIVIKKYLDTISKIEDKHKISND